MGKNKFIKGLLTSYVVLAIILANETYVQAADSETELLQELSDASEEKILEQKNKFQQEDAMQKDAKDAADKTTVSSIEEGNDTHLVTPAGDTAIADREYANNVKITRVIISDGVQTIGAEAFAGCKNLRWVFIPKSVTKLGKNVFQGCENLTVGAENGISQKVIDQLYSQELQYKIVDRNQRVVDSRGIKYPQVGKGWRVDGVIYTVVKKTDTTREVTVKLVDRKDEKEIVIPAKVNMANKAYKVVGIEKNAFQKMKKVQKVTVGKNVRQIENHAFRNCKKLSVVKILAKEVNFSGKGVWKGTSKKLVVKVPKTSLKKMRNRLKKTGIKTSAVSAL